MVGSCRETGSLGIGNGFPMFLQFTYRYGGELTLDTSVVWGWVVAGVRAFGFCLSPIAL